MSIKCLSCGKDLIEDLEAFTLEKVQDYKTMTKQFGKENEIYLSIFYVSVTCKECKMNNSFIITKGDTKYHIIQASYEETKKWFKGISDTGTALLKTGQIKTLVDLEKYLDGFFNNLEVQYVRDGLQIELFSIDIPGSDDNELV